MNKPRKFTPEEQEAIITLSGDGYKGEEIGAIYGVSKDVINARLRQWGVNKGTGGFNKITLSQEKENSILSYYEAGYSIAEVADVLEIGEKIVRRVLKEHGKNDPTRRKNSESKTHFSDESINYISQEYIDGRYVYELADEFEISVSTMRRYLIDWGVYEGRREPHNKLDFNKTEKNKIIYLYVDGNYTLEEVADELEVSTGTIRKYLNEWGIDTSNQIYEHKSRNYIHKHGSPYRIYEANYDFFLNADYENPIYWIGFIGSDGNVYENRLTIAIHSKDDEHLEKFRSDIESNHPISYRDIWGEKDGVAISITSSEMTQDLLQYNITERKSLTLQPPPQDSIPQHEMRHFWRGMVDGDGTLGIKKDRKWTSPYIGLFGTKAICEAFMEFCKGIEGMNSKATVRPCGSIWQYTVYGKSSYPIMYELYHDATVYLTRKKLLADKILYEAGWYD